MCFLKSQYNFFFAKMMTYPDADPIYFILVALLSMCISKFFHYINLQRRYFIQQSAANRDILVPIVISHAHLVPLAPGVLEIVLKYVVSNTAIMSLVSARIFKCTQTNSIRFETIFKFVVYVFYSCLQFQLFTITIVNSLNYLQLQENDIFSLEHQVNQIRSCLPEPLIVPVLFLLYKYTYIIYNRNCY